jgi:hypothetical protein
MDQARFSRIYLETSKEGVVLRPQAEIDANHSNRRNAARITKSACRVKPVCAICD